MRHDETPRDLESYETEIRYDRNAPHAREDRRESDGGGATARFLLGLGIGIGLALLFAPQSGEQTRRWLVDAADDRYRRLRRQGRRLIFETQDLLDRGEQGVTRALRTGKNALESVADKLEERTRG